MQPRWLRRLLLGLLILVGGLLGLNALLEFQERRKDASIVETIARLNRVPNAATNPRNRKATEEFRQDFPKETGVVHAQGYRDQDGAAVVVFEDGLFRGEVFVSDSDRTVVIWKWWK